MSIVVLCRHGETEWNTQKRFTGWSDPPLSDLGRQQALRAGRDLAERGISVDRVYTSVLVRAVETAAIMLATRGDHHVPRISDWRLNERHFGRLEGMTKVEVSKTWDRASRTMWRDDELAIPPPLRTEEPAHPLHDPRYSHVPSVLLPGSESRDQTARRVLEFWHECVIPDLEVGKCVMVVAHLGPLRIVAGHLHQIRSEGSMPEEWGHAEPAVCTPGPLSCCTQVDRRGGARPQAC